jgi:apolipoprotein N-acyltransferase
MPITSAPRWAVSNLIFEIAAETIRKHYPQRAIIGIVLAAQWHLYPRGHIRIIAQIQIAIFLPALAIALVSFAFGSIMFAVAVSWIRIIGPMKGWFGAIFPLILNALGAATGATIIAVFWDRGAFLKMLAVVPLISLMWEWTRMRVRRPFGAEK